MYYLWRERERERQCMCPASSKNPDSASLYLTFCRIGANRTLFTPRQQKKRERESCNACICLHWYLHTYSYTCTGCCVLFIPSISCKTPTTSSFHHFTVRFPPMVSPPPLGEMVI